MNIERRIEAMDGGTSTVVRGDPIMGERYYSPQFMEREWDRVWTRVWLIGGREVELEEPGDYVVHHLRHESILLVRRRLHRPEP